MLGCVSGGFLPAVQRGRKLAVPVSGHIAVADFYATFCGLSGHTDCTDAPGGGVPPTESYDMWPLFSGQTDASPRTETVLEFRTAPPAGLNDAAIVQGDWKYVQGRQVRPRVLRPFLAFVGSCLSISLVKYSLALGGGGVRSTQILP